MTTTLRDLLPPALRETYDEAQRAEERFDHTGDAEALTIAGRSRHAIITGLTSTPDSPAAALFGVVHGLCRVLVKWYRATGDERAIDEALRGARQVLEHLEDDADPLRPRLLTELGNALRARYERTGSADDFAEARAAYEAAHDAEPDNPEGATNLATSYLDGFHRTGRIAELESSIELMHEALAGTRIGDVLGAGLRAGNLSGAYLRAWHVTGDPDDLDAAIGYGGDALHVLPPGSPPRAEAANNYGIALTERYKDAERPDPADLDAALRAHQEAVTLQPNTLRYRTNLATTHAMLGDLTGAVDTLRGVVDALPSDAPERPGALANLGTALIDRGEPGDIDAAVAVLRTAEAAAQHVHPEQVVRAAASLGAVAQARDAWPEAAAAFERALTAAAQLFGAQGTDTHRDLQLTGHGGLAAEAAYARFMAGDAATAAEDLEAGRALQLTEALGLDLADLDALDGAGHTALRDRFVAEVAWLRELAARPGTATASCSSPPGSSSPGRRHRSARCRASRSS
ncbi:tetratricopeptide repeat protein [Dactylosporangium sp. NBC_01737]|uniref:hypothetical protein n=1 Tax=Dactylosporangium sp. NBC_01737 TaxID=2975959 RepID=UPI002E0FF59B|nr:tetratricopeptide repeat protein [Dactylosporangium sp. NBC_01737]